MLYCAVMIKFDNALVALFLVSAVSSAVCCIYAACCCSAKDLLLRCCLFVCCSDDSRRGNNENVRFKKKCRKEREANEQERESKKTNQNTKMRCFSTFNRVNKVTHNTEYCQCIVNNIGTQ